MIKIKKYEIVKSNIEFNNIINSTDKVSNSFYIIYKSTSNDIYPKFGIAVGKKIGNAVERNYIKRQIRRIIDNNKFLFQNNSNYIIIVKKQAKELSFEEKENSLKKLLIKEKK